MAEEIKKNYHVIVFFDLDSEHYTSRWNEQLLLLFIVFLTIIIYLHIIDNQHKCQNVYILWWNEKVFCRCSYYWR